ncbi:MAG: hypothetical protein HQL72_02305 [Magnetococcales bacterium]|nr:hypothetical protein [Magnetococcales bacterium]
MTATVMDLLKETLADQLPDRIITRDFLPMAQRSNTDLAKGVYTLLCKSEGEYQQVVGREAQGGRLKVLLLVQLKVGEKDPGSTVEDAEFAVIEEIKNLVRGPLPDELLNLWLMGVNHSGQLEKPFGWIAADLELSLYD